MRSPFRKKVPEEQRLLEHLGFRVILRDSNSVREIIGMAQTTGRLNFFIQLIVGDGQPKEHEVEQYTERVQFSKNHYSIEKDFLIGHCSVGKRWLDDILENESFIKAIVSVVDPFSQYTYLGLVAVCFHEKQLGKMSVKTLNSFIGSSFSITIQQLSQCPFLQFDALGNQFKFITNEFQEYYVAQEFSQFGNGLYKGRFRQPILHGGKYLDYALAPAKLVVLNELFEKIEVRKMEVMKQQLYEEAARLRDRHKDLFTKWVVDYWWDYTALDLTEARKAIEYLLTEQTSQP